MNISMIAQLAEVSTATVSRYLNNGYVSEQKRKRIQAVIEQTGYTPSSSAQTLRTGRNNLIGVIVPKISSESVSRMVEASQRLSTMPVIRCCWRTPETTRNGKWNT